MGITATPPCDQEAELLRTKFKLECGLHHPSFLFWGQSSYFSSLVFQPARLSQCQRQKQNQVATGVTMRGRSAIQIARRVETGRSSMERTAARMTTAFFWRRWHAKMATAQRHHLRKSRQSHSPSSWVSFSSPLQNNSVAIRPCPFRVNSRTSLFDLFAFYHVHDMMQPAIYS